MIAYLRATLIVLWLFFSCFIGLLIVPFRWKDPDLNRIIARLFGWGACRIAGVTVIVEGREHFESHQPCVYVANHQSGLDVATFGSFFPHKTVSIGKKELVWIPFFGQLFYAAGNIMIDRGNRTKAVAGMAQAAKHIRDGEASVFIFPEGTRNRTEDAMLPFKKGAFYMAIDAQVPIIPMVKAPLKAVVSWNDKKMKSGAVRIRVLPPIETRGMTRADVEKLSQMTRERMLEAIRGLAV